jgi:microcystin-dependent protein
MAYTISYTDSANKGTIVVEDLTLNTDTSLSIPGRNTTAYGSAIATNFLHLLENFAFNTQPSNGVEGQLWYDNTIGAETLKVYDGTNWVSSAGIKKAVSAPEVSASQLGDLWVDTDNQQLYLFSGSGWILVGPEFSDGLSTGVTPRAIIGTDNVSYTVIQLDVLSKPAVIISTSSFTPKTAISGFTTISTGFNLSTINITGEGFLKYRGTSEKAEKLIVAGKDVPAANFLRNDVPSTSNFPINIQNNTGINYGLNAELNIGIEGSAGVIQHQIEGSNIDVRVKNGGILTTVLRIDSNLRLGVNNTAPDEALDVTGNIKASGTLAINSTTESETIGTGSVVVAGGIGVAKNVWIGGTSNITGTSTLTNLMPATHNAYSLGTDAIKWKNIYSTAFTGNLVGNVSGTVSGRAGSADKLTSATTFELTGDVTATAFTFDGQSGGSTKSFAATMSNTIIGGKTGIASSQADDEFLLNRVTGSTGLAKISRADLFASVPTNPAGVMLAYGGNTAPADWLLCDGTEFRISDYALLYAAIGFNFGAVASVTTGFFKVPDLRGRSAVGKDNMGGTSANVITDESADVIGSQDGQANVNIAVTNLPDHKHDMKGDALTLVRLEEMVQQQLTVDSICQIVEVLNQMQLLDKH